MRAPHLLRAAEGPEAFEALAAAVAAAGLRLGWLETAEPEPLPPGLEAAAKLGVLRAVAAGAERTVAVKPRRGPAVLEDLLREHFRGCALVLVHGESPAHWVPLPRLSLDGDGFRVEPEGAPARSFPTAETLAAALRKARPWGFQKTGAQ